MTDNDLIKKIKGLKGISPNVEWMDSTRNELISKIELNEADFMRIGFFQWLKQPQAVALTLCLALILFGGPWMTLKASQSSLPGDLLYSVKKISEGVQTTIASDSGKVGLQAEFASRRLEELNKITYDSYSSEEKTEKSAQVMDAFKDSLAKVSQNVGKVSKEEAVAVAETTKKIEESLKRTENEISEEIKEIAEKALEDVKSHILAVLTEDEDNKESNASTTDEEILIFLGTTTDEIIEE